MFHEWKRTSISRKKHGKYIIKYESFSLKNLITFAQNNVAWQNARKNNKNKRMCDVLLSENEKFLNFKNKKIQN